MPMRSIKRPKSSGDAAWVARAGAARMPLRSKSPAEAGPRTLRECGLMSARPPGRGQRRSLVDRAVHFLDRDERRHADTHDARGIAHERHGGRRSRVRIVGDDDGVVLAIGEIEGFDLAARRFDRSRHRRSATRALVLTQHPRSFCNQALSRYKFWHGNLPPYFWNVTMLCRFAAIG